MRSILSFASTTRIALAALVLAGATHGYSAERLPENQPNFVLVMIDDLGWSDVGCYGNRFVETPNIDQMAAQGMRFTDFYAAGAVCSPTRASIQTGQNQTRVGITAHIPGHWRPFERLITPMTTMQLPLHIVTVAETLKHAGYATGYFGKWHLGNGPQFAPSRQGYDTSIVTRGHRRPDGQWMTDYLAEQAAGFMRTHHSRPFFLMISPFAVHIPLQAPDDKVEKYRGKPKPAGGVHHPVYAAMIQQCDELIGNLIGRIEDLGIERNTVFIFTSDNGGLRRMYLELGDVVTSNSPLRDEKGSLYEGGIRVPLIVKWPGVVQPGSVSAEPAISYDFYPTLAELGGASLPENQPIDGLSFTPLLKGTASRLARDAIHFHYPHYHHSRPAGAIRSGDYKLIEFFDDNSVELYDLRDDIGETENLADQQPRRAEQMRRALVQWRVEIGARMPIANPAYEASRAAQWWNRRTGEQIDIEAARRRWSAR